MRKVSFVLTAIAVLAMIISSAFVAPIYASAAEPDVELISTVTADDGEVNTVGAQTEREGDGDLLGTVDYAMELVANEIIEASTPRTVLLFILASLLCALLLVMVVIGNVISSFRRGCRAMRERRAAKRANAARQP